MAPTIDDATLAQQYGFALAVLQSDPDLNGVFRQAVAESWTADRFIAAVRNTAWFQKNNETWRNAQMLKSSDPATYASNLSQVRTRLELMASEMGADIWAVRDRIAENAYQFGWDDNQIRQTLAGYIKFTDGNTYGRTGQAIQELRARALDQGIKIDDSTLLNYAQRIASGQETLDTYLIKMDQMAASAYPHLAERLRAGETVADISAPYRQTMASLLEMAPDAVDVFDPTVRSALAARNKDGQPQLQTLYEFEVGLRKDPRWAKTNNARDAAMSTTRKVLQDWGLSS